jgi:DNA-binding GntR family transcriptional regulator
VRGSWWPASIPGTSSPSSPCGTCGTSTSSAPQRKALTEGDVGGYAELDRRFHTLIWHGSGNRRLLAFADLLGAQLRLGQNLTISVAGRPEASLDEHWEIIDAIAAGDTAAAEQATRRHVAQVIRALETALKI